MPTVNTIISIPTRDKREYNSKKNVDKAILRKKNVNQRSSNEEKSSLGDSGRLFGGTLKRPTKRSTNITPTPDNDNNITETINANANAHDNANECAVPNDFDFISISTDTSNLTIGNSEYWASEMTTEDVSDLSNPMDIDEDFKCDKLISWEHDTTILPWFLFDMRTHLRNQIKNDSSLKDHILNDLL